MSTFMQLTVSIRAGLIARDILSIVGHPHESTVLLIIEKVRCHLDALEKSVREDKPE